MTVSPPKSPPLGDRHFCWLPGHGALQKKQRRPLSAPVKRTTREKYKSSIADAAARQHLLSNQAASEQEGKWLEKTAKAQTAVLSLPRCPRPLKKTCHLQRGSPASKRPQSAVASRVPSASPKNRFLKTKVPRRKKETQTPTRVLSKGLLFLQKTTPKTPEQQSCGHVIWPARKAPTLTQPLPASLRRA